MNEGQYRNIQNFLWTFQWLLLMCIQRVLTGFRHYMNNSVTRMGYVFSEVQCRRMNTGVLSKLLRMSKWQLGEHETKCEILFEWEDLGDCLGLYPWCRSFYNILVRNIFLFIFYIWIRKQIKSSESIISLPRMLQDVNCESSVWKLWSPNKDLHFNH